MPNFNHSLFTPVESLRLQKFQSFHGHVLLTTEISTNSFIKIFTSIFNYCGNHHSEATIMPNIQC